MTTRKEVDPSILLRICSINSAFRHFLASCVLVRSNFEIRNITVATVPSDNSKIQILNRSRYHSSKWRIQIFECLKRVEISFLSSSICSFPPFPFFEHHSRFDHIIIIIIMSLSTKVGSITISLLSCTILLITNVLLVTESTFERGYKQEQCAC